MKRLGIFLILIIIGTISYGQQRTIYGRVTSGMDGKPMKGVKIILVQEKVDAKANEIILVETKIKTKTNEKGEYNLTVPDTWDNFIRFKKRGYPTKNIKLDNRTKLDVAMTLDTGRKKWFMRTAANTVFKLLAVEDQIINTFA